MKPQAFIFLGPSGSGKGTQADLLINDLKKIDPEHPSIYVSTGNEFRKFTADNNYTAKIIKDDMAKGKLMPEFMCIYVWGKLLIEKYTRNEHLVFDGTPRKLKEAEITDSIFPFYGIEKPWVIYMNVENSENAKRLKLRGRGDDGDESIKKRLAWFEEEVRPTVEHYRKNPLVRFLDIDGNRSIEEIHADIVKKVGLA